MVIKDFILGQTQKIVFDPSQLKSQYEFIDIVAAYAFNGNKRINLTSYLNKEIVDIDVPMSDWKITLFGITPTNQMVKRAAPGGEGLVMDYFDSQAYFQGIYLVPKRFLDQVSMY